MSTVAGMYFMRSAGQDIPTSECSVMESDANLNLSDDENTSCSNSEMGCDLSLAASNNNNKPNSNNTSSPTPLSSSCSSSSSRKNKRKNFKPRNITEYAGSDEEEHQQQQQTGGAREVNTVGMKLRQRLSAQRKDDKEDEDDEDDTMRDEDDEEEEIESEQNQSSLIISPRKHNGFAEDDDEDDDDTDDLHENDNADRIVSEEEEDEPVSQRFRHRDGPLDLSEVQHDSRRLWKKAKQDSSAIHSTIRNFMSNLNNNIDIDPSSYLSHQVAMAAAAAAAAVADGTNQRISGLPIMGLPGSIGIDLRLGRNDDNLNPPGGDSSSTTTNSSSNNNNNNNSSNSNNDDLSNNESSSHHHHHRYNLRHSSSSINNSSNHLNNSANNERDEEEPPMPRTSTPDHQSGRRLGMHSRQSVSPSSRSPSHLNVSANQGSQLLQQSLAGNSGLHNMMSSSEANAMNDFAQNTMKELLGLYGIAENLRQAGGKGASEMLGNLQRQQLEGATAATAGQHGKMMLPENMARFLAAMQESVASAAAAAAAVANQSSGNSVGGTSASPIVNGISRTSGSSGNGSSNNNNNAVLTGNDNSSSGTSNNNNNTTNNCSINNASSSSASSTPNPSQMVQHHHLNHSSPSSSSPTLSLNHQLNQPQLNHHHHQPLNFANISSLVQQPMVSSGESPRNLKSPPPTSGGSQHGSSLHIGNHHHGGGGLFSNSAMLKSAKTRSAGRSPTGRGLTTFPVIREGLLGKGTGPVDYTRYVRRYGNAAECGYHHCRELNYREHFHCLDCGSGTRVFVKKEEMIRHFKWHKKRDESLQHGFMRYSPMDDCSDRFLNCQHNRKQTHYHCLKDNCEKVYISTSDVQMHANYHRKDSAIIQEGFQRFRAVEDCGNDNCAFRHQRTTHFHCRRPTCSYTFKNKADMEKHKSYHIKDEQLNKDGFKKFMKHEVCNYNGCRFSRVCNHIHCIREGCNYVLHSSGQLYSHKRKHERRDSELAYRRFKLAQSLMRGTLASEMSGMGISEAMFANKSEDDNNSRSSFNDNSASESTPMDSEEIIKKFIQICQCDAIQDEHFHCRVENCRNMVLGSAEIASDHSKNHEIEERISSLAFFTVDPASFDAQDSTIPCVSAKCPFQNREKHYHCLWEGCTEIVLATDDPFRRLEHFRTHQYAHNKMEPTTPEKEVPENNDGFFKRKRGRPPKNRVIEVSSGSHDTAIFTSFKLPKPVAPGTGGEGMDTSDSDVKDPIGFLSFPEGASCPDPSCPYHQQTNTCHYHCGHPRCHFSVADVHKLSAHLRDFHSNVDILEGYAYYDRNTDCGNGKCEFRSSQDHFHCTRDGLTFVQYAVMMSHEAEAHDTSKSNPTSDDDDEASQQWNNQGSGTAKETVNHNNNNNPMDLSNGSVEPNEPKSLTDHSLSRILQLHSSTENSETQFGPEAPCGRAFCKLKRKHHYHCTLCNQAFSELDKLRPHVLKHSSFSPLKQTDSEQFTDEETVKVENDEHHRKSPEPPKAGISLPKEDLFGKHELPHGALPPGAFPPTSLPNFLNYPGSQSPFSHIFMQQHPFSIYAGMMFGGAPHGVFQHGMLPNPASLPQPHQLPSSAQHLGAPGLSVPDAVSPLLVNNSFQQQLQKVAAATKRCGSPTSSSPSSPTGDNGAKKPRIQMRILKDEPVPSGYVRFRFNEDCNYPHCGYREHQTHFHCTREDCGYSFCDKTRFVQHTARHERLDTLMGGDFKQFRANISCGRSNCTYIPSAGGPQGQNKASHFHCSKCDFVCTDTNKVVAHRRQHQKLDSITAAGFEKFTPSQNCNIGSCIHSLKQTHYHCLKCSYAVLGLSQMSAHKYRHADESN